MQHSPRRSPRLNDGQKNVSATAQTDTSVLVPQQSAGTSQDGGRGSGALAPSSQSASIGATNISSG